MFSLNFLFRKHPRAAHASSVSSSADTSSKPTGRRPIPLAAPGTRVSDRHDLRRDFRRDLAASFPAELAAIGAILAERIQREEDTLYPLYTPA